MGQIDGFLQYDRELTKDRDIAERIKDWQEFHLDFPIAKLKIQAGRCMNCGVPFCHMGNIFNGVTCGCPVYNLIPEWNNLVYQDYFKEALMRLFKTNNFPEFTGRVCPAPCEASCVVAINKPAVTIKQVENNIIEYAFKQNWVTPNPPLKSTGKTVAVVGSGPAGLACAAQLNNAGHKVTVFERADRIGGLLMYGIPNMKLDKKIVDRRVDLMSKEGVEFKSGVEVGIGYPVNDFIKKFDAVVLCIGATRSRDLKIEGRDLNGIHFAMEYLTANTKSLLDSNHNDKKYINAEGKNVVVIGGGDTGTDCLATSLRQRCKSITQLEILDKPPINRDELNPWPQWPKTFKTDYAQDEAAYLFKKDPRIYSVITKKFIGNNKGVVKSILIKKCKWEITENAHPKVIELEGTEQEIKADLVLLALGFTGPENQLIEKLNLEKDERSNIKAPYNRFTTNIKGIFTAGDCRRGQSLVVWAINEGRGAARECDKYLMGCTELP